MKATGIQIDGSLVRMATVKRANQTLFVIDLQTISSDAKVKRFYTESSNQTLVSGLNSDDLVIRSHAFSPGKKQQLKQALTIQTEAGLHFKPEELITISVIETIEKQAITYSTTRSALSNHLQAMNLFHLDPERVGAVPTALKALVKWKAPELTSYFILDIGLKRTNCVWVENDQLQNAHAVQWGLEELKTAFYEDRKKIIAIREPSEIDFSYIKTSHYPTLAEAARHFRREIAKLLHSFQCQRPLIFTGEVAANGFCEFLLEILRDCVTEEIKLNLSEEERSHAVCLGLAIDYLINTDQPIQFRISESLSLNSWRKLGRYAAFLLAISFLFSALFFTLGSFWIDKRENEIVQNLESWTAAKDPAFRLELFSTNSKPTDLVEEWLKLIEKNSKDYRFMMKAPKVSYALHWLTHHPLVESYQISFEQIRYQLVSCPRLDAMEDPYLVKIELSFKVASPLQARKFHEALLQGDSLVDASREITWETAQDSYQTTFYLKNE